MSNHAALRLVEDHAPTTETVKVTSGASRKYADRRDREHLREDEVERLMAAAGSTGRHRHRDRTLLLVAYTHGLRCSELVNLRWSAIDLKGGTVYVKRLKGSMDSNQPLRGVEIRALRRLQRDYEASPYVFTTERGGPLTTSTVRKIVARAGGLAGLGNVHPHQLRHSLGYRLANNGVDTRTIQHLLGHVNMNHTARYTALAAGRFEGLWSD